MGDCTLDQASGVILHFTMTKDSIKNQEQPETQIQLKQLEDEWPLFKDSQWNLLWDYRGSYHHLIGYLTLRLELASAVAEKVKDLRLYCAVDVDFCVQLEEDDRLSDEDIPLPASFHHELSIYLSKQSSYMYHYDFSKQFKCGQWNDLITVSATVKLVMLKCTLNIINEVKVPPLALGNELGGLLIFDTGEKKNKFTDVTFNITNESMLTSTFFAHKAVLAARSPVFAKMFEHDLQESATNSVTLSDINPKVFTELLTYIYTGKAPHIQTLANSLLNAAEKYQLGRLKAMCEQQMSYGLEVENAAETLVLAHTYGADQLKKNALMYIVKHRDKVRETKDWEKVHNMCELLEDLLDTSLELAAKKN